MTEEMIALPALLDPRPHGRAAHSQAAPWQLLPRKPRRMAENAT